MPLFQRLEAPFVRCLEAVYEVPLCVQLFARERGELFRVIDIVGKVAVLGDIEFSGKQPLELSPPGLLYAAPRSPVPTGKGKMGVSPAWASAMSRSLPPQTS